MLISNAPQVWSLHALALVADCGGPMFRGYVEPSLSLVLQLLLCVPPSNVDVHQCLGKCLAALITTIGPELQGRNMAMCAYINGVNSVTIMYIVTKITDFFNIHSHFKPLSLKYKNI
jgi:hypothetical protein